MLLVWTVYNELTYFDIQFLKVQEQWHQRLNMEKGKVCPLQGNNLLWHYTP